MLRQRRAKKTFFSALLKCLSFRTIRKQTLCSVIIVIVDYSSVYANAGRAQDCENLSISQDHREDSTLLSSHSALAHHYEAFLALDEARRTQIGQIGSEMMFVFSQFPLNLFQSPLLSFSYLFLASTATTRQRHRRQIICQSGRNFMLPVAVRRQCLIMWQKQAFRVYSGN